MTTSAAADIALPAEEQRRQLRRAVIASTVGTTIEWYDFFIYGTVTGLVFPKLYFPQSDPLVGTLQAFAVYAVGFIARPVGAAIFGHYGDRIGRKAALIATLLLMGIATFLVAFVPTYEQIGIWGAVILTVLRFIQGVGVGGEWGGSVLLSMEWARTSAHRGFIASWPQFGVPSGLRVLLWDRRAAQHARFPADRRPCGLLCVVLFDPARRPPLGPHRPQAHVPDRGRDGRHLRIYLFRAARHDGAGAHLSRDRAVADPARHAIRAAGGDDRRVLYAEAALQRRLARLSIRLDHCRRAGAADCDGAVRGLSLGLCDRLVHSGLRRCQLYRDLAVAGLYQPRCVAGV